MKQLSPPHGFTSIDELKNPGIVFRQSKTLVEVQVEISVIPGTKVVVHGIIVIIYVIVDNWE